MVMKRDCKATTIAGKRCSMSPLRGKDFCFVHAPNLARKRAVARKRGGLNRRRPKTPAPRSLELRDIRSVQLLLETAARDALCLDNGVSRCRVLAYIATVAARMLEVGELEQRLSALEEQLESAGFGGATP